MSSLQTLLAAARIIADQPAKLRKIREISGVPGRQLAKYLGYGVRGPVTISEIEHGKRKLSIEEAIAIERLERKLLGQPAKPNQD